MTSVFRKYSKPSADILALKASFLEDDARHLARHDAIAALYLDQPRREACKICGEALPCEPDFVSHKVPYAYCGGCGHLNGLHDDSAAFAHALYADEDAGYASTYTSPGQDAFSARLAAIYRPKADFLRQALLAADLPAGPVLDVGAGCGYFVRACRDAGMAAEGVEPHPAQAADAARFVGAGAVAHVALEDAPSIIAETRAPIVSFIGVLEHLRDPHASLAAAAANPHVKGVFFLVPMTGMVVHIENLFQGGFNRALGGGHTHLFSKRSLECLRNRHGFDEAAEWWFGTDAMDLRRHFLVALRRSGMSAAGLDDFAAAFDPVVDQVQAALDKVHRCSELHALWRKAA